MTFPGGGFPKENVHRLRGIVPVASLWNVDPTNLVRCTDGNWANQTGIGNKVLVGWGNIGQLLFDMGAVYNVLVRMKILAGNNIVAGSTTYIILEGSEDNVTYYPCWEGVDALTSVYTANYNVIGFSVGFLRARYLRLIWRGLVAGTWYGAVNEIQAIDLGL